MDSSVMEIIILCMMLFLGSLVAWGTTSISTDSTFSLKTLHSQHGGQVVLKGNRLRVQHMETVTRTRQALWVAQSWMGRQAFTATPSTRPLG
jgi:hypothetical protein